MAKGKSLHIGLNSVDPAGYAGWDGPLNACEADAEDMRALAKAQGFSSKILLTRDATRAAVLAELRSAASELGSGDIFFLTNSSHGGQVRDVNNDEDDNLDETWCLFDGQLIDDELYEAWASFAPGTRIVVLSDSCHSGTVLRDAQPFGVPGAAVAVAEASVGGGRIRGRFMPAEFVSRAYRAQKELYDGLQAKTPKAEADIAASVLLISGCQDPQTSMDGPFNGAFTGALLRVWNDGAFDGSYRSLHRKIQQRLPLTQQPNLMTIGRGPMFAEQSPFTIDFQG